MFNTITQSPMPVLSTNNSVFDSSFNSWQTFSELEFVIFMVFNLV